MVEKYSASLVRKQTFFREMIDASKLKNTGLGNIQLGEKLLKENYLRIMPERRNQEISSTVLSRLRMLNDEEFKLLAEGSLIEQKQVALIAIMKSERLIRDFMNEVYLDRVSVGIHELEDADFNIFFRKKAEEEEAVEKWKPVTVKKLKQVMKKILIELGVLEKRTSQLYEIIPPILSKEMRDVLEHEDRMISGVFLGGELNEYNI